MKLKTTNENTTELKQNEIFVFGSNLAGIHGAGAAKIAKNKFGAVTGIGEGLTGQCYALPTKDKNIQTLPLNEIHKSVELLLNVIKDNKDKFFIVTAVGCGLAGYTPDQIAPMFEPFVHLDNVSLPKSFINIIFPTIIKGYKVTDSEMKCRKYQFVLNKEHIHNGEVIICESGFHFCKELKDCFNYYDFNPRNRVFAVEGSGKFDFNDDKISVERITLIKELSWYEVLNLVNEGENNTGLGNSGNYNSGYYNSGDYNSGNYNSGDHNSGYRNSGNHNSGYYNSGNHNSGYYNSGYRNSGSYNSGYRNSGNHNSGNHNSGNYNSGNYNSGLFNTDEPFIRMFNKETELKRNQINIPFIDLKLTEWVPENKMTNEEKKENVKFYITEGYLKTYTYKEAWKNYWNSTDQITKDKFLNLPNFDSKIFEEITGIKTTIIT